MGRGLRFRGEGGFTLMEILVAMGVLVVGVTAVLGLLALGVVTHKRVVDETQAALLASAVVSDVQTGLRRGVSLEELGGRDFRRRGYSFYRYDLFLENLDPGGMEVLVVVVVRWRGEDRERVQVFRTILLR